MRKLISGKVYDEATATEIYEHVDCDGDLFTLYLSPKNQLFVCAEYIGDGSSTLDLINKDELEEWLHTHECVYPAVYERFGLKLEEG